MILGEEMQKQIAKVRGLGWYYCGLTPKGQFDGAVKVFRGDKGTVAIIFTLKEAYVIVTNERANITLTAAGVKKNVIQSSRYSALDLEQFECFDVLAELNEDTNEIELADNETWDLYGINKESIKREVLNYLGALVELSKTPLGEDKICTYQ